MKCSYCGLGVIGGNGGIKYCSDKCRYEAGKKRKRDRNQHIHIIGKCIVCNNDFVKYNSRSKFCSTKCRRKYENQTEKAKERRRKYAHTHRGRYEGITIDSDISLFKLAERDKQQCQICGLMVDWTDSPQGDCYPSIDHIKPISMGGLHSWNNIQLAHRRCNYIKSNKYIG